MRPTRRSPDAHRSPTPSPVLVSAPPPPARRPYVARRLAVTVGMATVVLLTLSVSQRWYALGGPGDAIYWLHDELFLPLKGRLWTALFPVGALMWSTMLAILLMLLLSSYLFGADMIRAAQTATLHLACERKPSWVVTVFRIGLRIGLPGELLHRTAHDRLTAILDEVRETLRQSKPGAARLEERLVRALALVAALDCVAASRLPPGPDAATATDGLSALLLAVLATRNESEVMETSSPSMSRAAEMAEGASLVRALALQIAAGPPSPKDLLTDLLHLLVPLETTGDSRSAQHRDTQALRHRVVARGREVARVAGLLDQGEIRSALALGIDGPTLAVLLLAAALLGLRAGNDVVALRIALEAMASVERLAIADLLRDGADAAHDADFAVAASAALRSTDARLHAAALARRLEASLAFTDRTWRGLVDIADTSPAKGFAVAAASEPSGQAMGST